MSVALSWLLNNSLSLIYYANNTQKKIVLPFNLQTLVLFIFLKDIGEERIQTKLMGGTELRQKFKIPLK